MHNFFFILEGSTLCNGNFGEDDPEIPNWLCSHVWEELLGSLNSFKEVLNRLRVYGNGYSMAIVLDHRSTATSLTGNIVPSVDRGRISIRILVTVSICKELRIIRWEPIGNHAWVELGHILKGWH